MAKYVRRIGTATDSRQIADDWAHWAARLEQWHLMNNDDSAGPKSQRGRAQEPRMKTKPLLDRPRLASAALGVRGGLGIVGRLWYTLRALTPRIVKAIKAQQQGLAGPARVALVRLNMAKILYACSAGLRLAWSTITDPIDRTTAIIAIVQLCTDNIPRAIG